MFGTAASQIADRPTMLSPESHSTLFTRRWRDGRQRVLKILYEPTRRVFGDLLDQLERGWATLLPLRVATLEWRSKNDLPLPHRHVSDFIDVEICDLFRTAAWQCLEMVPWPKSPNDDAELEDAEVALEHVSRNLQLVLMGADHPDFPSRFKPLIGLATEDYQTWLQRVQPLLDAALDIVAEIAFEQDDVRRESASGA